jgi:acyl-CoA thioester hydrolase
MSHSDASAPAPLDGFHVLLDLPVQWGDEDSFAHVNNVAYLRWCESGRIEYLRRVGFFPVEVPPRGVGPIVASVTCHYRRPLNYPDVVTVATRVTAVGNSSFQMEQRIVRRALGEVVAEASAAMVALDYAAGKPVRVPDPVREAIARLEQPSDFGVPAAG